MEEIYIKVVEATVRYSKLWRCMLLEIVLCVYIQLIICKTKKYFWKETR